MVEKELVLLKIWKERKEAYGQFYVGYRRADLFGRSVVKAVFRRPEISSAMVEPSVFVCLMVLPLQERTQEVQNRRLTGIIGISSI